MKNAFFTMKKRAFALILLLILLATLTGCLSLSADANKLSLNLRLHLGDDQTANTQAPTEEGAGTFPEEFSKEQREEYNDLIRRLTANVDFSPLSDCGFVESFTFQPDYYFAVRGFNEESAEQRYDDGASDALTASRSFRLHVPVFATVEHKGERIIGEFVIDPVQQTAQLNSCYYSKEYFLANDDFVIYEKMPSFSYMQERCSAEGLGTLHTVSLVDLGFSCNHRQVAFLKTDSGTYVYDPQAAMSLLNGPDVFAQFEDEVKIYNETEFLEAYFKHLEERADRNGRMLGEFFAKELPRLLLAFSLYFIELLFKALLEGFSSIVNVIKSIPHLFL